MPVVTKKYKRNVRTPAMSIPAPYPFLKSLNLMKMVTMMARSAIPGLYSVERWMAESYWARPSRSPPQRAPYMLPTLPKMVAA